MYKLITFDVYSASLDIYGSAIPRVRETLGLDEEMATQFFDTWRSNQWTYLLLKNSMRDGYKSYFQITRDLLTYVERKMTMTLSEAEKDELMKIWTGFRAWPEAKEALETIKARGYQIAMLSNGDEAMLSPLRESTGIDFDYIFSGDMAGTYKPTPGIYRLPFERLGLRRGELLHVAGSMFDVMGAKAAGLTVAWSNRKGEPILDEVYQPDYELKSLRELLDIL